LVGYAHSWGLPRVFYRLPGRPGTYSMSASWTTVEEPPPFLVVSAGRSLFRIDDLLLLADLIDEWDGGKCQ
jgi:hypothetical protein